MDEEKEVQMDHQLGEVLEEEGVGAHQLAKHDWLLVDGHRVVDTERVEHGGQQHVLTNEGELAIALHVWLSVR